MEYDGDKGKESRVGRMVGDDRPAGGDSGDSGRGLSSAEAARRLKEYGKNELAPVKKTNLFQKILHTLSEPMFLLLLVAATIYFILGEPRDGAIMLVFVAGIIGIEVIQEWKTDKTLDVLKDLSAPHITVRRDGEEQTILSADLVPGDLMLLYEGVKIPADGEIVSCNDLNVNESLLTGEPEGVWKVPVDVAGADGAEDAADTAESGECVQDAMAPAGESSYWRKDYCYAGTLVLFGNAEVLVKHTGTATEYGKIGTHIADAPDRPTPLEKETRGLVKFCAGLAFALFVFVAVIRFFTGSGATFEARAIEGILAGVTLAMAMIPEEFPVILAVFLSMGAWRLAKNNAIVRRLPAVETLGSISVLCVDKTGTITENQMSVCDVYTPGGSGEADELGVIMELACETDTYDPMESAMLSFCHGREGRLSLAEGWELISEYSFTSESKMMGHVWGVGGGAPSQPVLLAAKGSPESILPLCGLSDAEYETASQQVEDFARRGLRVIAVAQERIAGREAIPATLYDTSLSFCGLVGLADPPRVGIEKSIARCAAAGIKVVMITGDNGLTAQAIALQVGISCGEQVITGAAIDEMSDEELREAVKTTSIFSRVIPEHKMRIVRAFRDNNEVVAMTGDGVNDAPALKYSDIGISMGKRGSEVSREASDLILLDDNFETIVNTISDGRRIYDNIKKAIGYVFTIHIPIALISLLTPLLGIGSDALMLLPLHIVLLELVIDPTCSILLERQPAEPDHMSRPPRCPQEKIVTVRSLMASVVQGLVLFVASFGSYWFVLRFGSQDAGLARSMGLSVLVLANVFLVLVNSSQLRPVTEATRRFGHDKGLWIATGATLVGLMLVIYSPLNAFLHLTMLTLPQMSVALVLAFASTIWFEFVKLFRRRHVLQYESKNETQPLEV